MFRDAWRLVAPDRCLACGARGPMPWCASCAAGVRRLGSGCSRCATPRGAAHACWPADAPITTTIAIDDYRGTVAAAIATAKLGGARAGWTPLGDRLADHVRETDPDVDAVTYVTTAPSRVRTRGVDHAARLAARVGLALDVPVLRLLEVAEVADGDRYRAVRPVTGGSLLLVDDVLTTGATAWRAAAALHEAGADAIHLAVLARAGSHALGAASRQRSHERR